MIWGSHYFRKHPYVIHSWSLTTGPEKKRCLEDDPASYWVLKVTFQGLLLLNFRVGIGKRTRNCLGIEQKPRKQKKTIAKFKEPVRALEISLLLIIQPKYPMTDPWDEDVYIYLDVNWLIFWMVFHVGKFIPFMDPMATYPPEKLTVRPWKLGFPTRTFHLPTIHFQD